MNRFNAKKLLNSKWTAMQPKGKERHFLISEVQWNDEQTKVLSCHLEAVINHKEYIIDPEVLKDDDAWQQGWK